MTRLINTFEEYDLAMQEWNYPGVLEVLNRSSISVVSTILFSSHFARFPTVEPITKGLSFLFYDITKKALFGRNMLN